MLSLRRAEDRGFELQTSAGGYRAANVIVASGSFRRPPPRSISAVPA
jgi:thioredoxin reductase